MMFKRGKITFTTLLANSAHDKLVICFSYFSKNTCFYIRDNLHDMSNPIFLGKNKKNISKYRLLKILPKRYSNCSSSSIC